MQRQKTENDNKPFSSNCLRLTPGEWVFVGIAVAVIAWLVPAIWERAEKLQAENERLAAIVEKLKEPDMWWNTDNPEQSVDDPATIVTEDEIEPGGVFMTKTARSCQYIVYRVTAACDDATEVSRLDGYMEARDAAIAASE